MRQLPDVPGVIRVAIIGTYGGDTDVVTRFYVSYAGTAPTVAQLTTFLASVATAWGTNLKSLHSGDYTTTEYTGTDLTTTSSAAASSASAVAGTRAGGKVPGAAATVISYTISRRYRGGHPRGYWPMGVTTDLSSEQTWGNTYLGLVTTGINAFYTAVLAAGWTGAGTIAHVNVSYYKGFTVVTNPTTGRARNVPDLRVGGPITDTVTANIPRAQVGSQRRRNR